MSDFKSTPASWFKKKRSRSRTRTGFARVVAVPRGVRLSKGMSPYGVGAVHSFRQTVAGQSMTLTSSALSTYNGRAAYFQQTSVEASLAFAFCLADTDNNAQFTSLYDQYRIVKVELRFRPTIQQSVTLATSNTVQALPMGTVQTVLDFDDSTALAMSALRQYASCKTVGVWSQGTIKRTIRPRVAEVVWNTGVASGFGSGKSARWLDIASPNIPHYAIKIACDAANQTGAAATTAQIWEVDATYWLQFKLTR